MKVIYLFCLFMSCMVLRGHDISSVSFDVSIGAKNPYMDKFYNKLLYKLDKPRSSWFRNLCPCDCKDALGLLESLYNQCIQNQHCGKEKLRIPKIIHQIWVGPNHFPEKYRAWQKTWQSLPGWTYKLWTDEDVKDFPMINKDVYYQEKNYGARADILRIEILNREGGVYIDTDYECIQPEVFDELNSKYDFYCGITPLDCFGLMLNNAIIGSIPGHPILKAIITNLPILHDEIRETNLHSTEAIIRKGPGLFSRMFFKNAHLGTKDIALPPTFLYPLGVYQINNEGWQEEFPPESFFEEVKRRVIRPETIALHWWDGSWTLKESNEG